jgi:hypothetical protein
MSRYSSQNGAICLSLATNSKGYRVCKLPQKEYVLKVEKTLTLKRKNDEEIKI